MSKWLASSWTGNNSKKGMQESTSLVSSITYDWKSGRNSRGSMKPIRLDSDQY